MEFLMKMGFLHRIFGGAPREDSRTAAKDRLRNALVGDRCSVAPALLECMSADMLGVLKKYLVVSERDLRVTVNERDGGMRFSAQVPVISVLRQHQLPCEALADADSLETSGERRPKRKLRGPRRKSSEDMP